MGFSRAGAAGGRCKPLVEGSILQPDVWLAHHPGGMWSSELNVLQEAGIHSVMVQWTAETRVDRTMSAVWYPSRLADAPNPRGDALTGLLAEAKQRDMGVYIGLQMPDNWPFQAVFGDWPRREAATSGRLAQDIWSLFSPVYANQIRGWFLVPELEDSYRPNDRLGNPLRPEDLWSPVREYFQLTAVALHQLTPELPVICAPTFSFASAAPTDTVRFNSMLAAILPSGIDVVMVQDRTGEYDAVLDHLPTWYEAARSAVVEANSTGSRRRPVQPWNDAEFYRLKGTAMSTAPVSEAAAAISTARPYVSKTFCFSYDHWVSHLGFGDQATEHAYRSYLTSQPKCIENGPYLASPSATTS
ncbi:DUF4434 domain-containing protein [Streptomyces netropsis]|uniref:DUF4434 domain-containing protein n=1 Tax=Streptomyces netropsis TaxID=55404 RepID=UPI0037B74BDF